MTASASSVRHTKQPVRTLDRAQCFALLRTQEVGRIAVVSGGHPHVLPVNYVVEDETVLFRTAEGTKLRGATRGPVAFEVDEIDRASRTGWSVVLHGTAEEVTAYDSPELREKVTSLDIDPWGTGEKPHVFRVVAQSVTGRRLGPERNTD